MPHRHDSLIRLFLCGDVMTGRGIDQILPFPGEPTLHEPCIKDARDYVAFAELRNGPIPRHASPSYIWGAGLRALQRHAPDVSVINLETAVTTSSDFWPAKGIHYRMNPRNIDCITSAGIHCCGLANNHVLDWGYDGLTETLNTLQRAGLCWAGAGNTLAEARQPAVFLLSEDRGVAVYACGSVSSGIPPRWSAGDRTPGVFLINEEDPAAVGDIARAVQSHNHMHCVVVLSIHWGANWGYEITAAQRSFAHGVIDCAGVDLVFGHSSHHVKGLEVYRGKLIVYGAGDLITDYEGIAGYERYRGDLGLMYFIATDPSNGRLVQLDIVPTQMKRFQLARPSAPDVAWLTDMLNRESRQFSVTVRRLPDDDLRVEWT